MSSVELSRLVRSVVGAERTVSYREAAEASGLSASYLHKLAHGQVQQPSPGSLRKLALVPGLSYGALMRAAGYQ